MSASDLAQEAVPRLLRLEDAPTFDDPRALRAYLWTSAWRLLVNRMQSPGRAVVRLDDAKTRTLSGVFGASGGIGALEKDEQRTALEVVVNLPRPEDHESLGLVYFQGLPIDEAALRAGVSRGALDMRSMRARQRLAERLVDCCANCHTPMKLGANGPEPDTARHLSGHPQELVMPPAPKLPPGPWMATIGATMTAWSARGGRASRPT
jgi:DNA-directed RNA polymerase specialized sigma24 family protein